MQVLLNFTLQSTFYIYGMLGLMFSFKCLIEENYNSSIYFITSIVSLIIGYLFKVLFFKEHINFKNFIFTIFSSWLLLILVSSIPYYSLIKLLDFTEIIFLSTSYITTTGLSLNYYDYMKENDTLFIWSSLTQLIGGVFSILTFILFFLVLFNKNEKLVIFNKILILKFLLYYFFLLFLYILFLNFFLDDYTNSFLIASAIISTGGIIGENGHLLEHYLSDNNYLTAYTFLMFVTIFILPIFLYLQNPKIMKIYYLNFFKRSFFLIIVLSLVLLVLINKSFLNLRESLFVFLSFVSTTGLLPNKFENLDYLEQIYPLFFLFVMLVMIGSFSGSSSGGLKIDRLGIIFIKIKDELTKLTLRHKVYGTELIKKGSNQKELNSLYALIAFGIFIMIFALLLLSMSGKNIFESFAFSIAALTNTGDGFLHLYGVDITKNSNVIIILNLLMICGRFEIIGYLLIVQKLSIKVN